MDHTKIGEDKLSGRRSHSIPTGNQPAFSFSIPPSVCLDIPAKSPWRTTYSSRSAGWTASQGMSFSWSVPPLSCNLIWFFCISLGCSYLSTALRKKEIHISLQLPYLLDMISPRAPARGLSAVMPLTDVPPGNPEHSG